MNKFVTAEDDKKDFLCPTNNGNFADPSTCRRFYQVSINVVPYKYIQKYKFVPFSFHAVLFEWMKEMRMEKRISLFVMFCFIKKIM